MCVLPDAQINPFWIAVKSPLLLFPKTIYSTVVLIQGDRARRQGYCSFKTPRELTVMMMMIMVADRVRLSSAVASAELSVVV